MRNGMARDHVIYTARQGSADDHKIDRSSREARPAQALVAVTTYSVHLCLSYHRARVFDTCVLRCTCPLNEMPILATTQAPTQGLTPDRSSPTTCLVMTHRRGCRALHRREQPILTIQVKMKGKMRVVTTKEMTTRMTKTTTTTTTVKQHLSTTKKMQMHRHMRCLPSWKSRLHGSMCRSCRCGERRRLC